MSDLISRSATLEILRQAKRDRPLDSDRWVISDIANKVCKLPEPSVEPERKKGFWIIEDEFLGDCIDRCSMCGWMYSYNGFDDEREDYNFCPNCGADMRGGESDG